MREWIRKASGLRKARSGQTTAEYALIVALVAIACIGIITIFSQQIQALFGVETRQIGGDNSAQNTPLDTTGKTDHGLNKF